MGLITAGELANLILAHLESRHLEGGILLARFPKQTEQARKSLEDILDR